MSKAKKFVALVLSLCMLVCLFSCVRKAEQPASQPSTTTTTPGTPAETPGNGTEGTGEETPEIDPREQWAIDNGLYETETSEELYEKAKEEGSVTVYSISGRMEKVKPMFEEDYPGITMTAYKINTNELLEKFKREYEAGIHTADVIHHKEQSGTITNEYIKTGLFHNYQPEDIFADIDDQYKFCTGWYIDSSFWYYNTEVYPDGAPITSWWDLTKPEWKGKFTYPDPTGNINYMSVMGMIVRNADQMAEEYKRVFGEEIVLDDDEPNAGYAFIKRCLNNGIIISASADDVVSMVGAPGQTSAPLGFTTSSKLNTKYDQGYVLEAISNNFAPASGINCLNMLEIPDQAENVNAAKLLIRYLFGEADGKGRGFDNFNEIGCWSVRKSVASAENNIPFEQVELFPSDMDFLYENLTDVSDYWISMMP